MRALGTRRSRISSFGKPIARRCRSPRGASTPSSRSRRSSTSCTQESFLDEIRRVLRPDGLLILSCPNKAEYTDRRGVTNEFHVRELYRAELTALLASRFAHALWYGQRPELLFGACGPSRARHRARSSKSPRSSAASVSPGHARPLYFIVIASASAARLAAIAPRVSVLADRDEWVHEDYEKVMRDLTATHRLAHDLDVCLEQAHEVTRGPHPGARRARGRASRRAGSPRRRRSSASSTRSRAARASRGGSRCRCAGRGSR